MTSHFLWVIRNMGVFFPFYLWVIFKCSVMSMYKTFLMVKDSIDYFSKVEFYLVAEPLPDQSLAFWHGLGCQFSSNELNAVGWECGRQCLVHAYLLSPSPGSASECAKCAREVGLGGGPRHSLKSPWYQAGRRYRKIFWEHCCLHDVAISKCCLYYHSLQSFKKIGSPKKYSENCKTLLRGIQKLNGMIYHIHELKIPYFKEINSLQTDL